MVWLAEDTKNSPFQFKSTTIYRLKVQQATTNQLYFKLLSILEERVANKELQAVLNEFEKPIILKDEQFGEFKLDKEYACFYGEINWLGELKFH